MSVVSLPPCHHRKGNIPPPPLFCSSRRPLMGFVPLRIKKEQFSLVDRSLQT
ncbi:hypothetical protein RND71_005660 [Anisodus tanguticus]|uniref:Uncharacterized protein n=1 Tax=Anisodus tanguticus TaxID=243964 RepID=A0AAE1SPF2_9SOLA|nr:hypothetical protein RND71_005660 [Anisodus tanguticus]